MMEDTKRQAKRTAELPSAWVRTFIRKHGGVLNIAWRTVCMD